MVTLTQLSDILYSAERGAAGEPGVRALILLGDRYTIVFDTLYSPRDMALPLDLAGRRRRPLLVVNSHADYDHAWGNAAFPGVPIIGHTLCRERLLSEGAMLLEKQREDPAEYATARLCPPDITFHESLSIDAGGFTVSLHYLPGHMRDCIVAHIPEHGMLLAGDCAEVPIPLLGDGPLDAWIAALRSWAEHSGVRTVIPSHGAISGPELLTRNAEYLESLATGRAGDWQPDPGAPAFYREAHIRNVERAVALAGRSGPDPATSS